MIDNYFKDKSLLDGGNILDVLIDADAFVALSKKNDANHFRAQKISKLLCKSGVSFSTTNYVFSEVVTVLSKKIGHRESIKFIEDIKSEKSDIQLIWINEELEKMAIEIFKKQTSKNVSFVDCLNMAVLKRYRWETVFSFDKIYTKNGFKLAE